MDVAEGWRKLRRRRRRGGGGGDGYREHESRQVVFSPKDVGPRKAKRSSVTRQHGLAPRHVRSGRRKPMHRCEQLEYPQFTDAALANQRPRLSAKFQAHLASGWDDLN